MEGHKLERHKARGSLVRVDAVGGDFDFGNAAEGEQELYEVLGWLFRSLFHNVGNRVGDRGLEHYALGLQACKVYAHELSGLEHNSDTKIFPLRAVKCKPGTRRAECAPGVLNFRPSTRTSSFTRRPHFQALTSRIFFNLRLHSNANKKVIDTRCTFMLSFLVFANQNLRPSAALPAGASRPHYFRHRDENHVTASPLDSSVTNRDDRNPFRIRSYDNCRVSLAISSLFSLFAQRVIHKSLEIKWFRTLSENSRGVAQLFPIWNSTPAALPCLLLVSIRRTFIRLGIARSLCSPMNYAMRTTLRLRSLLLYLLISLLPFFSPVLVAAQDEQPTIRFVRNPDPAPDFKLTGLDRKSVTLAGSKGKVILLNFWATWCGPCRAEIPDLVELQNKYRDRLQILGLVVDDDDPDAIKKFAAEFGINYPVAIAPDELRIQYGGIAALPTSFVLDAEGRIVQKHEGLRDPVLYEMEIRSLLGFPIGNVKVETFEDTGQIFLKNADRASELPGVDLSKLTPEQKISALHKFNAETCTCGCKYTLAQCRIYDRNCQISEAATAKIVAALAAAPHATSASQTPAQPAPSATPSVNQKPAPVKQPNN